jgi:hypothetical protein
MYRALGIDYGTTTSDAPVEFGRGCDPRGMPVGSELKLVRDILVLEAERSARLVTCEGTADSYGRGMCRANVNSRYADLIGEVQDELDALCATRELTMDPMTEDAPPVDTAPDDASGGGDSTWLYVGGILGLLVIGGAAYLMTRKR